MAIRPLNSVLDSSLRDHSQRTHCPLISEIAKAIFSDEYALLENAWTTLAHPYRGVDLERTKEDLTCGAVTLALGTGAAALPWTPVVNYCSAATLLGPVAGFFCYLYAIPATIKAAAQILGPCVTYDSSNGSCQTICFKNNIDKKLKKIECYIALLNHIADLSHNASPSLLPLIKKHRIFHDIREDCLYNADCQIEIINLAKQHINKKYTHV